jgi:hypothetical protein
MKYSGDSGKGVILPASTWATVSDAPLRELPEKRCFFKAQTSRKPISRESSFLRASSEEA